MRRLAFAVLVLSSLAAHAQAPPTPARPTPALSDAECAVWMRELSFARSVAEHDHAAFRAHLHPGAVFGPRGPEPQRGADAVARGWAGLIDGAEIRLEWYPTSVVIGGEGDIAYSTGPALYEDLRPNAPQRYRRGGFQSVWHRGDDGVWRVLFDDGIRPEPVDAAAAEAFRAGRRDACPRA